MDTVEISKVKGHATEADVDQSRVVMLGRTLLLTWVGVTLGGYGCLEGLASGKGSLVPHHASASPVHGCGFPGFG